MLKDLVSDLITMTIVILTSLGIVLGVVAIIDIAIYQFTKGNYSYTDLNNRIGNAENCNSSYSYLTCYKEDGTVLKVKEYKKEK